MLDFRPYRVLRCERRRRRCRCRGARLLAQRFDEVPDAVRGRVERAEIDDLERWIDRVIPAGTLGDVFDDGQERAASFNAPAW